MRPLLYSSVLIAVVITTFAYDVRTKGIFACSADGYLASSYLAYCNATTYGDYDHGAFWFRLEPEAIRRAHEADVLFLGSSRLQFGLSTPTTKKWFAEHGASYYLLGFAYTENVTFTAPVLEAVAPVAAAYVINADGFFDDRATPPVDEIFHGARPASRYYRKMLWQYPHRWICGTAGWLCGRALTFFRARDDGRWILGGSESLEPTDVGDAPLRGAERLAKSTAFAREFVSRLPVEPGCVILTIVPWAETPRAEAEGVAQALGLRLIAPRGDSDMRTFDGSHLDEASAERWSRDFFQIAEASLQSCLSAQGSVG